MKVPNGAKFRNSWKLERGFKAIVYQVQQLRIEYTYPLNELCLIECCDLMTDRDALFRESPGACS